MHVEDEHHVVPLDTPVYPNLTDKGTGVVSLMTTEQIVAEHLKSVMESCFCASPETRGHMCEYHTGYADGLDAALRLLAGAGIDTEHTYEHPDLGIDVPWTAYAEWIEASGAARVKVIGKVLFVRRPLGGVS